MLIVAVLAGLAVMFLPQLLGFIKSKPAAADPISPATERLPNANTVEVEHRDVDALLRMRARADRGDCESLKSAVHELECCFFSRGEPTQPAAAQPNQAPKPAKVTDEKL